MNALEAMVALLNSPLAQAGANASQYTDLVLNLKQVSNDEIMKALELQNQNYLEKIMERLERLEK